MAHRRIFLLLAVVALAATAAVASTSSDFDDSNPIRSVTDHAASALESTVLAALGRTRDALRFARFAVRHGKRYDDAAEVQRRFRIFSESLELVRSTNRRGLPYRRGINRFADMSWEEFQASRLGAAQNCSATLAGNHRMRDAAALPETKDWREDGIVSPVKDQGHCGSCWTFSTTGSLEAAYTQATGKPVSLSEQQLVDCATAYNNFGCSGGLPSQAFEYIKYNGGLDTEEAYPYTGVNGICHYKPENVGVKEEFRAKQANVFAALDKLYILHNAILAESRFIKAFFFYCCIVFLIYMLTSAKQTFSIRGHLYFGLCITLLFEIGLIKLGADGIDKQFWVISKVFLVRSVFLALATVQMLHAIFTYRDYELLNHNLLQTLVEKVRALEETAAGEKMLSYGGGTESERSLRDYSWVFDELADEVDSNAYPSYALPEDEQRQVVVVPRRKYVASPEEVVGENSITTSAGRRYNLRPRSSYRQM